ncbi:uncharacterized protein LOC106129416 isoform X2 [Amyelois transitella]|uniref:uncharacterized protein LOC106129416 isoform X2 n=1 Tax=Amyelois transitella TaxID=680683 RepID=UPI00298F75AB|nr:uncharacterized protein LOC106129416 isoform X2 [Amyelois transitella]
MSVCGQTEEESVSEEMGAPIREIYEQKSVSKVVRVLTVLAYLLSVSLAAILLSVYYICVWKSPKLPLANDTEEFSARRGDLNEYAYGTSPPFYHRGSNITVNEVDTMPLTAEVHEDFANTSGTPNDVSEPDLTLPDSSPTALYNDTTDDMINNHTGMAT